MWLKYISGSLSIKSLQIANLPAMRQIMLQQCGTVPQGSNPGWVLLETTDTECQEEALGLMLLSLPSCYNEVNSYTLGVDKSAIRVSICTNV